MSATISPLIPAEVTALEPFAAAGVFAAAEIQAAAVVARLLPGVGTEVLLATALCVRALGLGHVCVVLDEAAASVVVEETDAAEAAGSAGPAGLALGVESLPWPDPEQWASTLRSSPAVALRDASSGAAQGSVDPLETRPLVFDGTRVYLERYWRYERQVGDRLLAAAKGTLAPESTELDEVLDQFFGREDPAAPDLQRRAASVALRRQVTVLAGGPGTGKTYTLARLLAAAHALARAEGRPLAVGLAAPTGKAAARMGQAVSEATSSLGLDDELAERILAVEAKTIHRTLGWQPDGSFRHNHDEPLPFDLVVVDETSMVDLPLVAKLFDALRSDARLVLVGDPFQLASVEAGAVLGDVVGPAARCTNVSGPIAGSIVVLERAHRFGAESAIATLADAVRSGDVNRALTVLRDPAAADVTLVDPDDEAALGRLRATVAAAAGDVVRPALAGDARPAVQASLRLKVLCGTRWGPLGSYAWSDDIERRLTDLVAGVRADRPWYVGRPVIVTRNDYVTGVFNGDTGIVVAHDDRMVVALDDPKGLRELGPSALAELETWWAMTIHKSQGSEFDHAVVSLPRSGSRILTNELLYTAITRGRLQVTVVASEEALRVGIERPIRRASGLQARLWS